MKELEALSKTIEMAQASGSQEVAKKLSEFGALLEEMNGALADVVGIIEKPNAGMGQLVAAIKGMHLQPPQIDVHVPPAASPVVHIQQPQWKALHIKVGPASGDGSKTYTITKT